jgi:hypothetical protein
MAIARARLRKAWMSSIAFFHESRVCVPRHQTNRQTRSPPSASDDDEGRRRCTTEGARPDGEGAEVVVAVAFAGSLVVESCWTLWSTVDSQ